MWFMMLFVNSCTGKSFRWRSVKICGLFTRKTCIEDGMSKIGADWVYLGADLFGESSAKSDLLQATSTSDYFHDLHDITRNRINRGCKKKHKSLRNIKNARLSDSPTKNPG